MDVEGDEGFKQRQQIADGQQQQQVLGNDLSQLGFSQDESGGYLEGMESMQEHIYTGDFEHQEGFDGELIMYCKLYRVDFLFNFFVL